MEQTITPYPRAGFSPDAPPYDPHLIGVSWAAVIGGVFMPPLNFIRANASGVSVLRLHCRAMLMKRCSRKEMVTYHSCR
jgi:hypothetical protein